MTTADIAIGNAGLVLTAPFLPRLFETLDLTDADAQWRSPEAQARAARLLQILVDDHPDAPDIALTLNRLLCGLSPDQPTGGPIVPTDAERENCQSLLNAMLANWPSLTSSSSAALQENFLQRDGRITQAESGWLVAVERKTLDVLLDGLPWSYSTILHRWMLKPLSVRW